MIPRLDMVGKCHGHKRSQLLHIRKMKYGIHYHTLPIIKYLDIIG